MDFLRAWILVLAITGDKVPAALKFHSWHAVHLLFLSTCRRQGRQHLRTPFVPSRRNMESKHSMGLLLACVTTEVRMRRGLLRYADERAKEYRRNRLRQLNQASIYPFARLLGGPDSLLSNAGSILGWQ